MLKGSMLIIGGCGFLGTNLYKYFSKNKDLLVSRIGKHTPINPYDYVINCAGKIHADIGPLFETNVKDSIGYCSSYMIMNPKCKYIHLGSSSEYGDNYDAMQENDDCCPTTDYAISKLITTKTLLELSWYKDWAINIVRPFSVYGKFDGINKFIPTIIRNAYSNTPIDLYPGSHDWIYADDFCLLCEKVLLSNYKGEIFNAGTGINTTNFEVIDVLQKVTKKELTINIKNTPYRNYDKLYWVANTYKSKVYLAWEPKITLEKGLSILYDISAY